MREYGITLKPQGSSAVTLQGEIKVPPRGARSTIQGMKLDAVGAENEIGPRIYASGVVLRHNRITNEHTGICVLVTKYYSHPAPRRVVIARNRIHDCGRLPATNHDHGIYVANARHTVIRRNWIYDNADRGIQLYPSAMRTKILGNVIDGNGEGIAFGGTERHPSSHNVVKHNVITNSRVRYNVYADYPGPVGRGNRVRFNCVYGAPSQYAGANGSGIQTSARGFHARRNLSANPRYANRAAHDYALSPRSRCDSLAK